MSKKGEGELRVLPDENFNHTDEEDEVQRMEVICLWEHLEWPDWDSFQPWASARESEHMWASLNLVNDCQWYFP